MADDFEALVLDQGGVFSRRQALDAGFTAEQIRRRVTAGNWSRIGRGVYADAVSTRLAREDAGAAHLLRAAGARLVSAPGTVLSHETAALAHGMAVLSVPTEVRLTQPRTIARRARGVVAARTSWAALPADHVVPTPFGPATTVARTVVDLARTRPLTDAVVAADSALHLKLCRRSDLMRLVDAARGWPGVAGAREVIDFADAGGQSPLESVSRVRLREQGLPRPELQKWVSDDDGAIGRVDFLWWPQRVIGEADGRVKYETREDLWREKRRQERLERAGFIVVRWTWAEITLTPHLVAERIRAAFARAAARRVA